MNEELKENGNINFPDEEQFGQFISQYRQLMLLYESAVQCVTVRLDTIGKEVTIREQRSPIRTVTSRIKEPHSRGMVQHSYHTVYCYSFSGFS